MLFLLCALQRLHCLKRIILLLCLLQHAVSSVPAQVQEAHLKFEDKGEFISKLLAKRPGDFSEVVAQAEKYEVQIIYTRITRDNENKPALKHFSWRYDPQKWFSPASLVKLPVAVMALEKLNMTGVPRNARMETGASHPCETTVSRDATSPTGYPSVEHYIKKIFAVSDNDAYNRLYEYLGQMYMNDRLWNMGYVHARLLHRYWACGTAENRCTNPITFFDSAGALLLKQEGLCNEEVLQYPWGTVTKGRGVMQPGGIIDYEPMDFTHMNFMTLEDLHQVLIAVMMPRAVGADQRFRLREEDFFFLRSCMAMLPREFVTPQYDTTRYHDSYVKYFMFGDSRDTIPQNIRIYNKVGQAYGYLSDVAYVVDYDKKIEFFLSAVIYCNEDGIFNDNKEEIKTVGLPFLGKLGRLFYDYEASRNRKVTPKLKRYEPVGY